MNLIKLIMAKLKTRKFVPSPQEVIEEGAVPMALPEIIEALKAYKAQNPAKYEVKKAALFARYGLTVEDEPALESVLDEGDIELEKLAKKAAKK